MGPSRLLGQANQELTRRKINTHVAVELEVHLCVTEELDF